MSVIGVIICKNTVFATVNNTIIFQQDFSECDKDLGFPTESERCAVIKATSAAFNYACCSIHPICYVTEARHIKTRDELFEQCRKEIKKRSV